MSARQAFVNLMEVPGWVVATEDSKNKPFLKAFDIPGVSPNLDSLGKKDLGVSHKEGRIDQILACLQKAVKKASSSAAEAGERKREPAGALRAGGRNGSYGQY